jgi:hypothetical protein
MKEFKFGAYLVSYQKLFSFYSHSIKGGKKKERKKERLSKYNKLI